MRNVRLDEAQAGINIARRNINYPRYAEDTVLLAEREEELKSLLMKAKEESEKAGLKFNTQKIKIMPSGPITSCQIGGENGNSDTLFSRALKSLQTVTAAMKLSILAPRQKSYDKPRVHIKKQRHYFTNKDPYSLTYVFSNSYVWMWEMDH